MSESAALAPSQGSARIAPLDGLRGVAAVIVLIHHSALTIPWLAAPSYGTFVPGVPAAWLIYSPLHIVWTGTEAVYLFFMLSGLVLFRSANRPNFDWFSYFPSRILRLYLPVVAAVAFAAASFLAVPRVAHGLSAWLDRRAGVYDLPSMLTDLLLITGASGRLSPLWSLQWEVLFSILLPLYVILFRSSRLWLNLGLSVIAMMIGAHFGTPALMYLSMFAIGASLGSGWERIATAVDRARGRRWWHPAAAGAFVCCIVLAMSFWTLAGLQLDWLRGGLSLPSIGVTISLRTLTLPLVVIGLIGLLIISATWEPIAAFMSSRVVQWLGLISFSLYLVHEPIVVTAAYLTEGNQWAVLLAAALAIAFAALFHRFIEEPAHLLSRRVKVGTLTT
jgi:peptidoglycan/LPS O-acetylase OafA/YrhL